MNPSCPWLQAYITHHINQSFPQTWTVFGPEASRWPEFVGILLPNCASLRLSVGVKYAIIMCFCSTLVLFREMRPSVHPFLTLARARRTASAPRDLLDLWYRNSLLHPLICLHFLFLCVSSPDKAVFSEDRYFRDDDDKARLSLWQWPYSFTFALKHTEDVFFNLWKEHLRMRQVAHVKKKKVGLGKSVKR